MITTFISGGKPIAAEVFQPEKANGAVVVLVYGSDGLVDNQHGPWKTMIRDYAAGLAEKGLTAVIPDYFQRTGTKPGDIDFQKSGAEQIWLHRDEWQATLADAVSCAQGLPGVDAKRAGLLGFSLGGHLALRVRSRAKALVEFFAPILDGIGPAGGAGLQAQIHHGDGDTVVSFAENAERIDRELQSSGAVTELCRYLGAGHGFVGTDRANTEARRLSKTRALDFLEQQL